MKSYLKTLGIVLILSGISVQGQEPPSYIDFSAPGLPGKLYVPPEASGSSPRPIIIGLHGAGGIGSDNSRQLFDFEETLDQASRRGAFLYLPQSTSAFWHINNRLETIMAMVDKAVTERGADPTRIYVFGFSMGGGGTWDMLSLFPNRIAAAVPVASIVPRLEFNTTEIAGIPIWAGHARDDTVVPFINTRNVLDALIDVSREDEIPYPPSNDRETKFQYVNQNINLRYTEFPTGGHPVWPNLFNDDLVNEWMFDQSRELLEIAVNVTQVHFDTVTEKLIVDIVTDPIADVGIESSSNLDSWQLDEVRVNTSGIIRFETSVVDRFYRFRGMQQRSVERSTCVSYRQGIFDDNTVGVIVDRLVDQRSHYKKPKPPTARSLPKISGSRSMQREYHISGRHIILNIETTFPQDSIRMLIVKVFPVSLLIFLTCSTALGQNVRTLATGQSNIGDGLAVDAHGNIYIASGSEDSVVWKATPDGLFSEFATDYFFAVGIAIDEVGNIYANDWGRNILTKLTPEGVKTEIATDLDGPTGLVFDSSGNIYITEFGANGSGTGSQILRVSPAGEKTVFASGSPINGGTGITIDELDNLYYTNWVGNTVYKIPSGSNTLEAFAAIPGVSNINQITYADGFIYVPAPIQNQIFRIDLAGNSELLAGTGEEGATDGPLLEAAFDRPNSVAVNAEGNKLYVIDNDSNNFRVIDLPLPPRHSVSTLIANQSMIGDGMAVDSDGNIFIASGNNEPVIWKVTPDGTASEFASGFAYAVGIAIDREGNVFANNYNTNVLTKISPEGEKSEFATGLNGPAGLVIDSHGFLYVTEFGANFSGTGARITKISPEGMGTVFASGGFLKDIIGIAIDELDNIYFTNFTGSQVYKIPKDSETPELFATIPGNTMINQITYSNGYVYIPSGSLNQIYRVDLTGQVEVFAGTGSKGSADGLGLTIATFSNPNSIAANPRGDKLYVIDDDTNNLRVIDLSYEAPKIDLSDFHFDPNLNRVSFNISTNQPISVFIESSETLNEWVPLDTILSSEQITRYTRIIEDLPPKSFFRARAER